MDSKDTGFLGNSSSKNVPKPKKRGRVSSQGTEAETATPSCDAPIESIEKDVEEDEPRPAKRQKHQAALNENVKKPATPSRQADQTSPPFARRVVSTNNLSTPRSQFPMLPNYNYTDRGPYLRFPHQISSLGALSSPIAHTPTRRSSLGMMRVSRDSGSARRARRRQQLTIAQPLAHFRDGHDSQR